MGFKSSSTHQLCGLGELINPSETQCPEEAMSQSAGEGGMDIGRNKHHVTETTSPKRSSWTPHPPWGPISLHRRPTLFSVLVSTDRGPPDPCGGTPSPPDRSWRAGVVPVTFIVVSPVPGNERAPFRVLVPELGRGRQRRAHSGSPRAGGQSDPDTWAAQRVEPAASSGQGRVHNSLCGLG